MEPKDIGRIKKHGYFRGTKANVIRFQFVAVITFVTCAVGAYKIYFGSPIMDYVMSTAERWRQEDEQRNKRIGELQANSVERIKKLTERDDF